MFKERCFDLGRREWFWQQRSDAGKRPARRVLKDQGRTVSDCCKRGNTDTKKGDGALCRVRLEPRQRLSRHFARSPSLCLEQVKVLAAVALVEVNIHLGRKTSIGKHGISGAAKSG